MSFIFLTVIIGVALLAFIFLAVSDRHPIRGAIALLGFMFLGFSLMAAPPSPKPPKVEAGGLTVENFGDAKFRDFYDRYSDLLGAALGPATQYDGILVQWFKLGRLELRPESRQHPDFPNLALGFLGEHALAQQTAGKLSLVSDAQVPPVLQKFLDGRAKTDFYRPEQSFVMNGDSSIFRSFEDFNQRYKDILGSDLGPIVSLGGLPVKWHEYGRIELHNEYDRSLNRDFPNLQLGRVGAEYLERQGRKPDDNPKAAPVLAQRLTDEALAGKDIQYFYGNALTHPIPDTNSGFTTQFYERAVFRWASGSANPNDVFRIPVGRDLYSGDLASDTPYDVFNAKRSFTEYFCGRPLTEAVTDTKSGMTTQYFQKAGFTWPSNSVDPTEVRQVPLGRDLYVAQLGQTLQVSAWSSPARLFFLGVSTTTLVLSGALLILMREGDRLYSI